MTLARQRNNNLTEALAEARELYAAARPESAQIHLRARAVLPGGNTRSVLFYTPFPTAMARGEAASLEDVDGHRYVDFCGEYTAGLFGHSEPRIRAALHAAIAAFIDQHNAGPQPFRWTKSADDILASIERFCVYNATIEAEAR